MRGSDGPVAAWWQNICGSNLAHGCFPLQGLLYPSRSAATTPTLRLCFQAYRLSPVTRRLPTIDLQNETHQTDRELGGRRIEQERERRKVRLWKVEINRVRKWVEARKTYKTTHHEPVTGGFSPQVWLSLQHKHKHNFRKRGINTTRLGENWTESMRDR